MDLSFPKNLSVNSNVPLDTYMNTKFMLTLPTIDNIVEKIVKLGRVSMLFKVDIARAFRHLKIDPADFRFLDIFNEGFYYDTALAFDFRHGSTFFQRTSDSIRSIMMTKGYDVINYIDDVIGLGVPSVATKSYETLVSLLQELGLDINESKNNPPNTVTALGH